MKNEILSTSHIVIHGFMVKDFNLKGTELLIYALIYGFSQDGQGYFYGSRTYISEWFNISLPTVDTAIDNLVNKKLIFKEQEVIKGITYNKYKINNNILRCTYLGSKIFLGGSKKTLHNNILIDNIISNNIYNKSNNIIEDINNNIYNNIQKEEINKEEKDIFSYIEENFGRTLSPIEYEEVLNWNDNELTRYAIQQAVLRGKYNIKYISTTLLNYEKNSITSVIQAKDEELKFKNKHESLSSSNERRQESYKRMEEKYKNDN